MRLLWVRLLWVRHLCCSCRAAQASPKHPTSTYINQQASGRSALTLGAVADGHMAAQHPESSSSAAIGEWSAALCNRDSALHNLTAQTCQWSLQQCDNEEGIGKAT